MKHEYYEINWILSCLWMSWLFGLIPLVRCCFSLEALFLMWGQEQIEISPGNVEKKEIVLRRFLCRHVAINRSKVQCHSIYPSVRTSHRQSKHNLWKRYQDTFLCCTVYPLIDYLVIVPFVMNML